MMLFGRNVAETERLVLRHWTSMDMRGFLRFAADPEVMMAAGARPVLSPEEAGAELERCIKDPYCFAITLKSSGEVIGKIKYQNDYRRPRVNSVSIGYELARQYWGHGYMTEAVKEMVKYAFDSMNVDIVAISHFAENERSRRVIEKVGFRREGVVPMAYHRFDGRVFAEVTYSILREEYITGKTDPVRSLL